uniref:1-phosphatidylinositol 4-kinase n=1 Tax=Chromera velia CCMP2878 TaxID=1169474 RepID=A0A0G4H3A0_9ALVE|eukprot:Cvel_24501.t1-p1 / transcript=Cvel_24501.t1 / gene=Cvel_24501 / organism=Chromera_velia_CCMP2878 / gene_product=Phosphatidylinositol 4-kinase, putative / transcript_product=Phosphatidylinositol 4-kinase, putative / location=Cvel_scaffold2657:8753-19382(-) / protein_length=838 / sequence_SO=supercontig / SO=protein_coding / is_pseudo=false
MGDSGGPWWQACCVCREDNRKTDNWAVKAQNRFLKLVGKAPRSLDGQMMLALVGISAGKDLTEDLRKIYEKDPKVIRFYVPQLGNYLIHAADSEVKSSVEGFVFDVCKSDLALAHQFFWYTNCSKAPGEPVLDKDAQRLQQNFAVVGSMAVKKAKESRLIERMTLDESLREMLKRPSTDDALLWSKEFNRTPNFLQELSAIANRLIPIKEKEKRRQRLHTELLALNDRLPQDVYLPIVNRVSDKEEKWGEEQLLSHCILRVPVEEAFTLHSKDRAPYHICVEVLDFQRNSTAVAESPAEAVRATSADGVHEGDKSRQRQPSFSLPSPSGVGSSGGTKPFLESMRRAFQLKADTVDSSCQTEPVEVTEAGGGEKAVSSSSASPDPHLSPMLPAAVAGAAAGAAMASSSADGGKIAGASEGGGSEGGRDGEAPGTAQMQMSPVEIASEILVMPQLAERGGGAAGAGWAGAGASELCTVPEGGPLVASEQGMGEEAERTRRYSNASATRGKSFEDESGVDDTDTDMDPQIQEAFASMRTNGKTIKGIFGTHTWTEVKQRVRERSPFGHLKGWRLVSVIVKTGAELRQELFAAQLLNWFQKVWRRSRRTEKLWLKPFHVLATDVEAGLIETIPNAVAIDSIKKLSPGETLLDFYKKTFRGTLKSAQQAFVNSMAAYSIICYMLNIRDRHNANILIDSEGHVIHVDFGFMFTNSPGNIPFEPSLFKLTNELVEVMGGPGSSLFNKFRERIVRGFMEARRESQELLGIVEMMMMGQENLALPCFRAGPERVLSELRERLFVDPSGREKSEMEVTQHVCDLVERSVDNWRSNWYDRFQRVFVGIS